MDAGILKAYFLLSPFFLLSVRLKEKMRDNLSGEWYEEIFVRESPEPGAGVLRHYLPGYPAFSCNTWWRSDEGKSIIGDTWQE
jgi:hypothetical protein